MKKQKNVEQVEAEDVKAEVKLDEEKVEQTADNLAENINAQTDTEKPVLTKAQKAQEKAIIKAAKKKRKKEKRAKIEPDEFVKHLQINKKQYLAAYITFLSVACSILLFMVVTMMVLIPIWWVQLIDLAVLGYCIWRCVHLCLRVNRQEIYTLYGNCLIVQSIMVDTIIPLKNVYSAEPYTSWAGKLFKKGPHCIRLNLSEKHKNYVVIGFIEEDLQPVCDQIMANAENCRKIEKAKAEQSLKELQIELEKVRNGND